MPGDLAETSLVDLCLRLAGEGATGTLAMSGPRGDAVLVFVDGRLAGSHPPAAGRQVRLGERLVSAGRLDRPDLDALLAEQAADPSGPVLGRLLVDRGLASRDTVRLFVQEQVLETLLEALTWFEGRWDFHPGDRVESDAAEVSVPVDRALMEVRRRAAERERVAAVVGSAMVVPSVVAGSTRPASLPTDAFTVLAAVDGTRTVAAIAEALGYSHDETRRQLFRLALQRLVEFADSETTTTPTAAPTEEAALPASSATGTPAPVHLADDGWATRRQHAATQADEPEPWVGWAHGAPEEPIESVPSPAPAPSSTAPPTRALAHDTAAAHEPTRPQARPAWAPQHDAPVSDPAPATTPSPAGPSTAAEPPVPASRQNLDADTRRALFSELHEVGRATPHVGPPGAQPAPAPASEPEAAPQPPAPSQEPPQDAVAPSLSRSDVSELLAELHALNLDEDR